MPYLPGIEFHFFDDPKALAAAYRDGTSMRPLGCRPPWQHDLASAKGSRALRYPGSTLTAVLLNLRPGHPEFSNPAVRTALLEAIDRPSAPRRRIRDGRRSGDRSHPALVGPVRPVGRPTGPLRHRGGAHGAKEAGWTSAVDGWHLANVKTPITIELLSPDQASNPGRLRGRRGGRARLDARSACTSPTSRCRPPTSSRGGSRLATSLPRSPT